MGLFIRFAPFVQVEPVVRQRLGAQRDLGEGGPNLGVELVAVDAAIAWGVLLADEAGEDLGGHAGGLGGAGVHIGWRCGFFLRLAEAF